MVKIGEKIQDADWKKEKHVPVIDCADTVKANETFEVKVAIGKDIAHPNTTEHHIRWIMLYYQPEGEKALYQVGNYEFTAHGESPQGPNTGPIFTNHEVKTSLKIAKSGTLFAVSLCNIHGLWEYSKEVKVN
ncbi:MAG TPA: class II SORL domain-containing protein [Methanofastidiosum sp.]|nr:class II SORL domain-containing protein [Methanofastidiosum sp.]HPA48849.1 class II SORL domain-containing protein [Methanofastidiosum sp.]HQK62490.1 class II SORL domain-containing protein [Methanofastidiosum sp.]HQM94244.1 class II SORL domain-containing protein [Methanofastidiosum sp.]HQQ49096.1 class II SORL domain-containing protein [Methanofastidiosum sp.]